MGVAICFKKKKKMKGGNSLRECTARLFFVFIVWDRDAEGLKKKAFSEEQLKNFKHMKCILSCIKLSAIECTCLERDDNE